MTDPARDTDMREQARLVIVGGGPGGYAAAFRAADMGLQTVLIDPEVNPGGACLYRGCIPSKALLHVAQVLTEAREGPDFGITFAEPRIDLAQLRSWKDAIVTRLTTGLGSLVQKRKITYIQGRARFLDERSLEIDESGGKITRLPFKDAILATGSRPIALPGQPPASPRILDSSGALNPEEVPGSLLVIGGGYIGLELGTVYAALGTKVTVVEMTGGLLPGVDRDLVSMLKRRLDGLFADILLRTRVERLKEQKNGVMVDLVDRDGQKRTQRFQKVLVAVGRRPSSGELGLEKAGVTVDDRGFVQVDAQRRTSAPTIWAIGDVAGEPMLAHKATHEGRTAAEAIAGRKVAFEPRAIPAVVFTDPEIAWCGLTQDEARQQKREVKVVKLPWSASGRAATLNRSTGLTKLIVDPESERILGVGLAGPGAGELIAEGVLAMEMAAVADDLRLTIHPHPTLSETLMETAEELFPRHPGR